jgi:hypothetical protein
MNLPIIARFRFVLFLSSKCRVRSLLLYGCSNRDWRLHQCTTTLFWKDRWLSGKSANDIAPLILAIPARIANKITVCEVVADFRWVYNIHGTGTVQIILEFLSLCQCIDELSLQPGVPDKHI